MSAARLQCRRRPRRCLCPYPNLYPGFAPYPSFSLPLAFPLP